MSNLRDKKMLPKVVISLAAVALAIVDMTCPGKLTPQILVLFGVAALPWLTDIIATAKIWGIEVELRNQGKVLDDIQSKLMTVIMYGMSSSIYTHLWNIHQGKVSKTTFTYYDNPPFSREMYFLRDAGYIRPSPGRDFLDFNTNMQGQDLASICELTPIGEIVVEIRGTPARVGRC